MEVFATFEQYVEGYTKDTASLPDVPGIYFVLKGYKSSILKNAYFPTGLLYVGQSKTSIKERLTDRPEYEEWKKELKNNETIIYAYTRDNVGFIDRIEAAYIYFHQPKFNIAGKEQFNYPSIRIKSTGQVGFCINADFSIPNV